MIALFTIIGIVVLFLVVAAIVGTAWSFEKSIQVNAAADRVWQHMNSFRVLNEWNPWSRRDPGMKQEITGTDGHPGAMYSWDSQERGVGAGSQTIVRVTDKSEMQTRIDFIRPFKGTADAFLHISEDGGGTRVSWKINSSTPYPMNIIKLFGVIEKNMDKDFTEGLNRLKSICES